MKTGMSLDAYEPAITFSISMRTNTLINKQINKYP